MFFLTQGADTLCDQERHIKVSFSKLKYRHIIKIFLLNWLFLVGYSLLNNGNIIILSKAIPYSSFLAPAKTLSFKKR